MHLTHSQLGPRLHCLTCSANAAYAEELLAEVGRLKELLSLVEEGEKSERICKALGITGQMTTILWTLYTADRLVPVELLCDALDEQAGRFESNSMDEVLTENVLRVQIHNLRSRLGARSIETVRGAGYRLSPAGRRSVDAALRKTAS